MALPRPGRYPRRAGHEVSLYDTFYWPDAAVLKENTILSALPRWWSTCTTPAANWIGCGRCFARGWLGIMTKLVRDSAAFASWHYKNDPTHVFFQPPDLAVVGAAPGPRWTLSAPTLSWSARK